MNTMLFQVKAVDQSTFIDVSESASSNPSMTRQVERFSLLVNEMENLRRKSSPIDNANKEGNNKTSFVAKLERMQEVSKKIEGPNQLAVLVEGFEWEEEATLGPSTDNPDQADVDPIIARVLPTSELPRMHEMMDSGSLTKVQKNLVEQPKTTQTVSDFQIQGEYVEFLELQISPLPHEKGNENSVPNIGRKDLSTEMQFDEQLERSPTSIGDVPFSPGVKNYISDGARLAGYSWESTQSTSLYGAGALQKQNEEANALVKFNNQIIDSHVGYTAESTNRIPISSAAIDHSVKMSKSTSDEALEGTRKNEIVAAEKLPGAVGSVFGPSLNPPTVNAAQNQFTYRSADQTSRIPHNQVQNLEVWNDLAGLKASLDVDLVGGVNDGSALSVASKGHLAHRSEQILQDNATPELPIKLRVLSQNRADANQAPQDIVLEQRAESIDLAGKDQFELRLVTSKPLVFDLLERHRLELRSELADHGLQPDLIDLGFSDDVAHEKSDELEFEQHEMLESKETSDLRLGNGTLDITL